MDRPLFRGLCQGKSQLYIGRVGPTVRVCQSGARNPDAPTNPHGWTEWSIFSKGQAKPGEGFGKPLARFCLSLPWRCPRHPPPCRDRLRSVNLCQRFVYEVLSHPPPRRDRLFQGGRQVRSASPPRSCLSSDPAVSSNELQSTDSPR